MSNSSKIDGVTFMVLGTLSFTPLSIFLSNSAATVIEM